MPSVENAKNQNTYASQPSDGSYVVIEGRNYQKYSDGNGEYIIMGGTKKVYLADYYETKERQAKKERIQNELTNFFSKQEGDFAEWRDYYASKISVWTAKAAQNKCIYQASRQVVLDKEAELRPLYDKYNTFDINKFSDGKDKKLGLNLLSDKRHAKSEGNVAFGQMQTDNWIAESYRRLMNHSEFCREMVTKIADITFNA